ncbi:UDP-N-acetylmuramate dehydrogenase, partial [Streptococcus danieliae]|nr:UDP-N-acetylmuramate dehydrogenase [Streptococcus danieliae]
MISREKIQAELEGIDIRFDYPLKEFTYTKVGGPVDYLVFPRNKYELLRIVKLANREEIPW